MKKLRSIQMVNGSVMIEQLMDVYRKMRTIRAVEETLESLVMAGRLSGFLHLYAGEEAVAVGVCEHLGAQDVVASTHRGHGHCIAKGVDVRAMMFHSSHIIND